jgi:hypothetical protein
LPACAQVKEQFRRAGRLSHLFPHLTAGGSVCAPALPRGCHPFAQASGAMLIAPACEHAHQREHILDELSRGPDSRVGPGLLVEHLF